MQGERFYSTSGTINKASVYFNYNNDLSGADRMCGITVFLHRSDSIKNYIELMKYLILIWTPLEISPWTLWAIHAPNFYVMQYFL